MKTSLFFLLLFTGILFSSSCKKDPAQVYEQTAVQLRIENTTNFPLEEVVSNGHLFGQLKGKKTSQYVPFGAIINQPNIKAQIDGEHYRWLQLDQFSSDNNYKGKYTLVITAVDSTTKEIRARLVREV